MGYARYSKLRKAAEQRAAQQELCEHPSLCAFLGFAMPLIGLVVAAIIDKAPGVKKALIGVVWRYVVSVALVLLWCCFV